MCTQHTTPWAESREHNTNLGYNADLHGGDTACRFLLIYLEFTLSCHSPLCWTHTVNLYILHFSILKFDLIHVLIFRKIFQISEANPIPYFSIHIKCLVLTQGLFKDFLVILFSGSSHGFLKKNHNFLFFFVQQEFAVHSWYSEYWPWDWRL